MANLKLEEKRTTNHKMKLEGTLIIEDGLLTLVQYNDFTPLAALITASPPHAGHVFGIISFPLLV